MTNKKVFSHTELKAGDKLRVINAGYATYGLNLGDVLDITQADLTTAKQSGGAPANIWYGKRGVWLALVYFERASFSKAEIVKDIAELEKEITTKKNMLSWMKETKSEEYDETEFKVWSTLQLLDSNSTQIQKARAIAALIKGG